MNRRALVALVRKDLVLELRGREVVLAMVVFVLAAFVLFRFGLGGQSLAGGARAAVGVLWIATVFTAMLGLTRSFAAEREGRVWDGLLASPVDRAIFWAARTCSTCLFSSPFELWDGKANSAEFLLSVESFEGQSGTPASKGPARSLSIAMAEQLEFRLVHA